MKALELAEEYADAVAAHRLESLYGTSKSYTLEKASERDEAHEALAAELRRLSAVEADCAPYLKEGETPAARIKRELGDSDSLMSLYRDVVAERDALKAELERIKELPPVATVMAHPTPSVSYSIRAIHGIPHGTELYALGSKT